MVFLKREMQISAQKFKTLTGSNKSARREYFVMGKEQIALFLVSKAVDFHRYLRI